MTLLDATRTRSPKYNHPMVDKLDFTILRNPNLTVRSGAMKKEVHKLWLPVFFICAMHALVLVANPRLDIAQRTYFENLDKFVSHQIDASMCGYTTIGIGHGHRFLAEIAEKAAQVETILINASSFLSNPTDFKTFLREQSRVEGVLAQISDLEEHTQNTLSEMKEFLGDFNQSELCSASISSLLKEAAPHYDPDESIDLSKIPPLTQNVVKISIGSEVESADLIEKGLYLPATMGGCAAGQALLFFLPIIGCVIGAAVGGGAAYGAGKLSTAIITESENQKEHAAYQKVATEERARQAKEIAEAKSWINDHPINGESITHRATRYCSKLIFIFQKNLIIDAEDWLKSLRESKRKVEKISQDLENNRSLFRAKEVGKQQQQNVLLVKNRMSELSTLHKASLEQETQRIRVDLANCLIDGANSCDELVSCIEEAQIAFEVIASTGEESSPFASARDFLAEINRMRIELSNCKPRAG